MEGVPRICTRTEDGARPRAMAVVAARWHALQTREEGSPKPMAGDENGGGATKAAERKRCPPISAVRMQ